jgi:uncharacterized phage-associated protein
MSSKAINIIDILYTISRKYYQKNGYPLGKTKLIKLAYLAEIFHQRIANERLTDEKWIYWHYGPYIMNYNKILDHGAFKIKVTEEEFSPVMPSEDYNPSKMSLTTNIAISRAMEFSELDLNDLLDFVYFDTEPMMKVKDRGEALDFKCVLPESEYRIKPLEIPRKQKQEILKKIEDWGKLHG